MTDERRDSIAFKEFRDSMKLAMSGFHEELQLHTTNNEDKMKVLVAGQERIDRNLQTLHDDQLVTTTTLGHISETMKEMQATQVENSGEIREHREQLKTAGNERVSLRDKVALLEKSGAVNAARLKSPHKAPVHFMESKYIQASIAIVMILFVIGMFRAFGNIDVAGDASQLMNSPAMTP